MGSLIHIQNVSIPQKALDCELCVSHVATPSTAKHHKYSKYPPLILFNTQVPLEDAKDILEREKCTHAAINSPIPVDDIVRRPQITPLIGDFGEFDEHSSFSNAFWCTVKQNGIFQTWAPLYTMFSRGNITEKARVLEFDNVRGTDVVDLYCGIGYFTFSYARAGAKRVFGWEINPWSVEGLRRAAMENKWNVRVILPDQEYTPQNSDRLVIFQESNEFAPKRLAALAEQQISHINMGLLPDCRLAWSVAKDLATEGTIFHVHENVHESDLETWAISASEEMGPLVHLEKIKQFAPRVWHVCGDFAHMHVHACTSH